MNDLKQLVYIGLSLAFGAAAFSAFLATIGAAKGDIKKQVIDRDYD